MSSSSLFKRADWFRESNRGVCFGFFFLNCHPLSAELFCNHSLLQNRMFTHFSFLNTMVVIH